MPILVFNERKILFVHIPKTAGASIESHLRNVARVALFCGNFVKLNALKMPCSPQHFHIEILRAIFPRGYFDWQFTVVRNPLDRLKSEYRMRRGRFVGEEVLPFPAWVGAVFKRHAKNPYVLDNHIRPQVEFVDENVEVFRFEDGFESVLRRVADRLGVPEMRTGEYHKQKHPALDIECPPDCLDEIAQFYRADYETFGYALPTASGMTAE